MKIEIIRSDFLKTWQMAERSSSAKSTLSSLSGVLVTAEGEEVWLSATDLKTSIRCAAEGVNVIREGAAILPVKLLGELFKKAPSDKLTVEVKDEKGLLMAGRNKTKFATWPVSDFPKLADSGGAQILCDIPAGELLRLLVEGSIASSPADDFPKYLGACLLQLTGENLRLISTDTRRLSLSKWLCGEVGEKGEPSDLLLPVLPLRELQRLLASTAPETPVRILYDGSLTWFQLGKTEFSIRRVESSFPNYEKILNPVKTTTILLKRDEFLSALDRIDIIVRSHTRLVVMHLSPGGSLRLTGKAPEFGVVVEELDADIGGDPIQAGFNVGFLQDGLKALGTESVRMNLNGEAGQATICREEADDFLYMLMPIRITEQDIIEPDDDEFEKSEERAAENAAEETEGKDEKEQE
ncbi:MAG: DNA polymerase III subunit beta [Synergistaceae bacterium]|jgi:DNA polymerase-3 subunit beta|nr:DNA polymerase III subunit beta [Synergistaceae bacterium]